MKKIKLNHLLLVVFLLPAMALAQWQSKGPYGGSINAITKINNLVFAGTQQNGVFVSDDEGVSWAPANNGLKRRTIMALVSKEGNLYAGTSDNGVYFSSDNGASWTNRSVGLGSSHIVSLFASAAGVYASTAEEVFFTNDNGLTWTRKSNGLPFSYSIYSWAQVDDIIFAGTYASGLYSSIDGVDNWAKVPGYPSLTGFVYALETNGNDIWAGASGGILHSDDGGVTWNLSNTGMPMSEWAHTIEYKSGVLLAGTHNGGLFRSTDNGNTWTAVNSGIQYWPENSPQVYASFNDIEFVGSSTALAGNREGMYRSTDNGVTWSWHSEGILANEVVETEADENTAYAATSTSGMFVSEDQGQTWIRRNNGLPAPNLLATATQDDWAFAAVMNDGLYRTNDKGMNWTEANNGIIGRVESIESDDETLLAVTAASRYVKRRLWKSTDHGASWTEVNTDPVSPVAAVEVRGENIYTGGFDGSVFWTRDGGESWTDITGYIPTTEVSAILSLSNDEVYVSTRGKGVWKITNYGHNAVLSSSGLMNMNVTDLAYQNNILFAGTWGGGIFVSQNQGGSWFQVNGGLENKFIDKLGAANMKVYCSTSIGVYQSGNDLYDEITVLSGFTKHDVASVKVGPNPCAVNMSLSGLQSKNVEITIYDLDGRIVLKETAAVSGEHKLDVRKLEHGIYILTCIGEADSYAGKIVVE